MIDPNKRKTGSGWRILVKTEQSEIKFVLAFPGNREEVLKKIEYFRDKIGKHIIVKYRWESIFGNIALFIELDNKVIKKYSMGTQKNMAMIPMGALSLLILLLSYALIIPFIRKVN